MKIKNNQNKMESDTESEQSEVELDENDDENRLSDAEFPISEEEDDEDDEEMDEESEEDEEDGKGAWANSIAKILNTKHTGVLSKAQKIEDIERNKQKKKENTFEVVGAEDVKIKEEKPDEKSLKRALEKRKRREKQEVS